LLTRARASPRVVLFLSESSLALYLFHRIFQKLTLVWFTPLPDALRIAGQFAVGLGGSVLLVLVFRRIAGPVWARRLIGG
jgi:surface polysaccharide O-acyltransferase-like enzyme